jgi:hypothetical protein
MTGRRIKTRSVEKPRVRSAYDSIKFYKKPKTFWPNSLSHPAESQNKTTRRASPKNSAPKPRASAPDISAGFSARRSRRCARAARPTTTWPKCSAGSSKGASTNESVSFIHRRGARARRMRQRPASAAVRGIQSPVRGGAMGVLRIGTVACAGQVSRFRRLGLGANNLGRRADRGETTVTGDRIAIPFAAVHMSAFGTKRIFQLSRRMSAATTTLAHTLGQADAAPMNVGTAYWPGVRIGAARLARREAGTRFVRPRSVRVHRASAHE